MEKVFLTEEGKLELEKRLDELKNKLIPDVIRRTAIAKDQGDLSENAEYHSARDEHAKLEGEKLEIEDVLKRCEIIVRDKTDDIQIGAKIKYLDIDMEEEYEFTIVGTAEADISKQKISIESPVGQSLIGKKVGDVVTVTTPKGEAYDIKILEILN